MNKLKYVLFAVIISLFVIPYVKADSISIKSIDLTEKSETTIINSEPTFSGLEMNYDLTFKNVNDYAMYRIVIENNCTSAIESLYLRTPCISYRPYVNEIFDQPLPNYLSENAFSEKDVIDFINLILNNTGYDFDKFLDRAKQYISFQEKDESITNIVNCIDSISIDSTPYSSSICKRRKYNLQRWPFLFKILIKNMIRLMPIFNSIINILPARYKASILDAKFSTAKKSKYDEINKDIVKQQLYEISKFKNSDLNIDIDEVSGNIIIIPL